MWLACERAPLDEVVTEARSASVETELVNVIESARSRKLDFALRVPNGPELSLFVRVPTQPAAEKLPGVLLLAGFETGRAALDLVPERDDVVLMSMDYAAHGVGSLDQLRAFDDINALRRIGYDALYGAALALGQLANRPDVDPDRIVVVGVSFGSLIAVPLVGHDPRPDAVVLVYGGGDLPMVVRENLGSSRPWFIPRWALATITRVGFGEFDPLEHAAAVAPRPLLMVSSSKDRYFPPASAQALFDAASEPKQLVWVDTDHMALFEPDVLLAVMGDVLELLAAHGVLGPSR